MKRKKKSGGLLFGVRALQAVRAALLSCILTAVFALLLAFLLRWEWFSTDRIRAMNTLIKALSAIAAGVMCAFWIDRKSWLYAGCAGTLYIAVSYAVFSILEKDFTFRPALLSDLLLGFICAGSACIIVQILRDMRKKV